MQLRFYFYKVKIVHDLPVLVLSHKTKTAITNTETDNKVCILKGTTWTIMFLVPLVQVSVNIFFFYSINTFILEDTGSPSFHGL